MTPVYAHAQNHPGATKMAHDSTGAPMIIDRPQTLRPRNTRSRTSGPLLATTSAPLVENGEESTTDDEIASAMIRPTAPTAPPSRNGTASGIRAPRMPVVDANADTAAPIRQITNAASSGTPILATLSPSMSMVPMVFMTFT